MAHVHGTDIQKYHPTKARETVAAADVRLLQVQVIDKNHRERAVVVWQCGPDILVGETMDALFDADRRFNAPEWLVKGLLNLPPSRQFDCFGNPKSGVAQGDPASGPLIAARGTVPEDLEDGELPGIDQA